MNDTKKAQTRTSRSVWIVAATLLLLTGAVWLVAWLSSGPSAYASGHRWALYPSTGESPEPDSSSKHETLAFEGNVKLFSLLHSEHLTDGKGERIREAVCHVLIDLPPKAVLQITGGGGLGLDNFDNYKTANVILQGESDEPPLEQDVKIRYRFSDRRLAVFIGGEAFEVQTGNGTANVFVVRINNDGKTGGIVKTGEQIPRQLDANDVERLMAQVDADVRL